MTTITQQPQSNTQAPVLTVTQRQAATALLVVLLVAGVMVAGTAVLAGNAALGITGGMIVAVLGPILAFGGVLESR